MAINTKFSEEDLQSAISILHKSFKSPAEMIKFWKTTGSSWIAGPPPERCKPWTKGLRINLTK